MDRGPIGAIQNLGVVPAYRGMGLGRALVRQALDGFYQAGLRRAYLEVTAENSAAVQLYRSRRLPPGQDPVQGRRRLTELPESTGAVEANWADVGRSRDP